MTRRKTDKRVQRTQQALRNALLDLIIERGYEKLSVQDILDRACVGRATFYLHYRSKEDLLRKGLDGLRDHLMQEWQSASQWATVPRVPLGFSLGFFRHVDSHRRLYRAVVGRESGVIVDRHLRRVLADLVRSDLMALRKRTQLSIHDDLSLQYVVGALMSVVTWWLDRNIKLSPEQVDAKFRQMTLLALRAPSAEVRSPLAGG